MRYAILIYNDASAAPPPPDQMQAVMGAYDAYTQQLKSSGAFQAGDPLQPVDTATTIRERDGRIVTTDGPFAETKEALGGFYVVEASDLDEALELAGQCPAVRFGGSVEVRPVMDFPPVSGTEAAASTAQR